MGSETVLLTTTYYYYILLLYTITIRIVYTVADPMIPTTTVENWTGPYLLKVLAVDLIQYPIARPTNNRRFRLLINNIIHNLHAWLHLCRRDWGLRLRAMGRATAKKGKLVAWPWPSHTHKRWRREQSLPLVRVHVQSQVLRIDVQRGNIKRNLQLCQIWKLEISNMQMIANHDCDINLHYYFHAYC